MESKINESEGLLSTVVSVAMFGLALFFTDILMATGIIYILCLVWTHPKIKKVGYDKLGSKILVLEAIVLLLLIIHFLLINLPYTLLSVLILSITGLITIITLDARAQQSSVVSSSF